MERMILDRWVLAHPWSTLIAIAFTTLVLSWHALDLEIDASAETLLLEDDPDLATFRAINQRYGSEDFLIVTFTPHAPLLDDSTLAALNQLNEELLAVPGVSSVTSLLDVPLLTSSDRPLSELLQDVPTVTSPGIDRRRAREELVSSPLYADMLVSRDFTTTAIQVNLTTEPRYFTLLARRDELTDQARRTGLSSQEAAELTSVRSEFKQLRDRLRQEQHEVIRAVREVLDRHRAEGQLHLGGATMIADDTMTFVRNDLRTFGIAVVLFLGLMLWLIFRRARWVAIPAATCAVSVTATSGLLALSGWEVTVISSNFVSLQLILTLAITIHLIVRYREELANRPDDSQRELVLAATRAMWQPCLFMGLTTAAGFASLVLSGIRPVANFGWMMSAGIGISLCVTFLLFPAILVLLEKTPGDTRRIDTLTVTARLARITEHGGHAVLMLSIAIAAAAILGTTRLKVENSFIDYFRQSTEIHQGMKLIDGKLGGTTPLDVVVRFNGERGSRDQEAAGSDGQEANALLADFDQFEFEYGASERDAQYWFTPAKMEEIERVHDYLDALPETGKVISLGTMLKVGRALNDGNPLDGFALALIYNELPEEFRALILDPYVDIANDEVRFAVRVRDSDPQLRRDELLKRIERDLHEKLGMSRDRYEIAGMLVLYNNMLQSLYRSQVLTIGAVVFALGVMFLILFRSPVLGAIAIVPNALAVGSVLGLMGWAGIPLDMMTITIAAICVGIAVDDTIHYIHRFRREYRRDGDYLAAMHRCHRSIGHAMYYTTVTVVSGFSILVLSNFIPSIYFGLLTGLAMIIALLGALTVLPALLVAVKPFGPAAAANHRSSELECVQDGEYRAV